MGCDISSSSVKMVEIAEAGRNVYRVERYAIEPLPKDTVVDGNIANIEAAGRGHQARPQGPRFAHQATSRSPCRPRR